MWSQISFHSLEISIHALREESDTWERWKTLTKHYFNPRPPRGERRYGLRYIPRRKPISIHALREESDPRLPISLYLSMVISIHALREESDNTFPTPGRKPPNFNPRPPRGERLLHDRRQRERRPISIHALREEGDPDPCGRFRGQPDFNPRPPRGGRRTRFITHSIR